MTRRTALATTGTAMATVAATPVVAQVIEPGPAVGQDAQAFLRLLSEFRAAYRKFCTVPDEQSDAACELAHHIGRLIEARPAQSMTGVAIKLYVADILDGDFIQSDAVTAAYRDAERLAGLKLNEVPIVEPKPHPDAELLEAGRAWPEAFQQWCDAAHVRNDTSYKAPEWSEVEHRLNVASERCNEIIDTVCSTPASTIEGMRVKAQVALDISPEDFESPSAMGDWCAMRFAASIAEDLLEGGAA